MTQTRDSTVWEAREQHLFCTPIEFQPLSICHPQTGQTLRWPGPVAPGLPAPSSVSKQSGGVNSRDGPSGGLQSQVSAQAQGQKGACTTLQSGSYLLPAMILRYWRARRAASPRAASLVTAEPWHTVAGWVDSSTRHWHSPLRLSSSGDQGRGGRSGGGGAHGVHPPSPDSVMLLWSSPLHPQSPSRPYQYPGS